MLTLFNAINERYGIVVFGIDMVEKIALKLQRQLLQVLSVSVLLSEGSATCMTKPFPCCGINFRYQKCTGVP